MSAAERDRLERLKETVRQDWPANPVGWGDHGMRHAVCTGNAADDGAVRRGWFIGHFMGAADGPRRDSRVEVKWGYHPAGEARAAWVQNEAATTLSILVRGRFRISFAHGEYLLAREGDYVLWPPGIAHHWRADEDSVILTVRWPSAPDDSVPLTPPV